MLEIKKGVNLRGWQAGIRSRAEIKAKEDIKIQ